MSQYPVIGPQIKGNLGTIPGTGLPLIIGAVLLLLGARGVAGAMQNALCEVWGIKREERPGFPMSQVWAFALLLTVGLGFIVTTFLSGVAGGVGHVINGTVVHVATVLISLVLNVGVFWLSFRIATARMVPWRDLRIGAAIAAVCWQILQVVGGYVISHQLHRASELYGTFGIVLGLLAWLFLQAEVTLYAAEVDVVLARRLWPRSVLPAKEDEPAQDSEPAQEAESPRRTSPPRKASPPGNSPGSSARTTSPPTTGLALKRSLAATAGLTRAGRPPCRPREASRRPAIRRQGQPDDGYRARRDRRGGLRGPVRGRQAAQVGPPRHRDRQEPLQHVPAAALPGGDRRP